MTLTVPPHPVFLVVPARRSRPVQRCTPPAPLRASALHRTPHAHPQHQPPTCTAPLCISVCAHPLLPGRSRYPQLDATHQGSSSSRPVSRQQPRPPASQLHQHTMAGSSMATLQPFGLAAPLQPRPISTRRRCARQASALDSRACLLGNANRLRAPAALLLARLASAAHALPPPTCLSSDAPPLLLLQALHVSNTATVGNKQSVSSEAEQPRPAAASSAAAPSSAAAAMPRKLTGEREGVGGAGADVGGRVCGLADCFAVWQ